MEDIVIRNRLHFFLIFSNALDFMLFLNYLIHSRCIYWSNDPFSSVINCFNHFNIVLSRICADATDRNFLLHTNVETCVVIFKMPVLALVCILAEHGSLDRGLVSLLVEAWDLQMLFLCLIFVIGDCVRIMILFLFEVKDLVFYRLRFSSGGLGQLRSELVELLLHLFLSGISLILSILFDKFLLFRLKITDLLVDIHLFLVEGRLVFDSLV